MTREVTLLIEPDQPEWDRWLHQAPHDFYHLAAYHSLAQSVGDGRAYLFVHGTCERFLAWPYLVRDLDEEYADATSVYGYSGPTGRGLEDDVFRTSAWAALRAVWSDQRLVTVFTRFHPLLENNRFCCDFHGATVPPGGEILQFGRSVSIDLSLSTEGRRAQYPQPLRQDIKRAERLGLTVEIDQDWACLPEFAEFYKATMRRNNANDDYLFSNEYFDRLRVSLDGITHLAVARYQGEAAAALLFTVYGEFAAAHLTGVNDAFARHSPLKALIDRTCEFAQGFGAQRFHLGAGRGGIEDSLYEFKARFSPLRHFFLGGRWILDEATNARMAQERSIAPHAQAFFFPAYRASGSANEV